MNKRITKSGILKQRKKLGAWRRVAKFYQIRPITLLAKAKGYGIETGKRVAIRPLRKPPARPALKRKEVRKLTRRVYKAIRIRKKAKRERTTWFKERKGRSQTPTKQGWWLTYRIQEGTTSPPYKTGEFWWSQRAHYIHANEAKPDLAQNREEALDRGNPAVRKGWFRLVWCEKTRYTKEGKLISRGY